MSYLTLHRDMVNAVALCGLYDGALRTYLQAHPEIRRIALYLDADELGRKPLGNYRKSINYRGMPLPWRNRAAARIGASICKERFAAGEGGR
mgnify:CR=1 FL=1